jgi:hypothetical protein
MLVYKAKGKHETDFAPFVLFAAHPFHLQTARNGKVS